MKKPKWVVEKEQAKKAARSETVWLFGLHAVRDALSNPRRERLRLIVTLNAQAKLAEAIAENRGFSIAGGGDTLAAVDKYQVANGISYISTGGGAFLEYVEGKTLPAVAMLEERAVS